MAEVIFRRVTDTDCSRASTMKLPTEVMNVVLTYCDRPTRYNVLQTCSQYHDIAIPHVYRDIILSSARQVRAFECLVRLAKCTRERMH